jgi:hypothetical protein
MLLLKFDYTHLFAKYNMGWWSIKTIDLVNHTITIYNVEETLDLNIVNDGVEIHIKFEGAYSPIENISYANISRDQIKGMKQ